MARPPISGGQGGGGGGVESQFEEEEEEVVVTLEIVGDRARGEERESEARDLGTATDDKAGGDGGGGGVESIFQEEELTAEEGVGGHARGEVGAEDLDHGDEVEEDSVERVLLKLKVLCAVLGSNYKEKLDEIGLVSGSEIITSEMKTKLLKMVQFLQGAKQERFEKMQKSANELLSVWKKSKQPVERLLKVYQIFDIISAKSADEIITEKFLSAPLLKKIEKEKKSILSADLTLLKEKYQRNKKKLQQLLKDQHLTTLDVGFNAKEKIDEVDYPNKIESIRELIKNLRKNRLPRMLLVLKMELIGTGRNEKFSVEQLKSLIQVTKAFVRESLSDGEACMYDGRDVMDVLIEAERKLDPKQGDSCKDYQSSRSVRLAARLKKKEMGSCTVQEAAVSSISIRRKLRSGMDKNRDEVPMSKEAADTAKSKAQEDLTEAERDASNPPED